jgi:hypothetical protein
LFVDASGRVIIGASTAAIGNPLEVVGNSASMAIGVRGRSADNIGAIGFYPNASSTESARIQSNGDSSLILGTGSSGTERLRITSAGLVGIGTSSPSTTLAVAGGISGTAALNISGSGWGVLPYVANSLVIDNNAGETRFFATGADATTKGSFIFYNGETDGGTTTAMVIDTSSRVGIGTASPGSLNSTGNQLVVGSGTGNQGLTIFAGSSSDSNIYFADGTAGTAPNIGYIQYRHASDRFDFGTNDTTRMSIDSSGRLLVGTSTAGSNELLQIQGVSGSSVAPGGLALKRSSVGNTDDIGFINFQNGSGNTFSQIKAICDGTPGASDYPGALTFSTTADGAASPAERFRISSTGAQFSVVPGGTTIYPQFACRAWVNFNGTGTVAIRASGNVSSITDNGTGLYTANFTTAMPDTNYTMMGTHSYMDSYRGGVVQFTQIATGGSSNTAFGGATQLTGSCAFRTVVNNAGATPNDPATVLVTFFR